MPLLYRAPLGAASRDHLLYQQGKPATRSKTSHISRMMTKDDLSFSDQDEADEGPDAPPPATRNYITPAGLARLQAERQQLWRVERPEIVRVVEWAAGNGDRSENGDYIYGKKRLREIDRRLRFLDKRLAAAEPVDPAQQKNRDRVFFGATVTYLREDDRDVTVTIVGTDETEMDKRPGEGSRISWVSPVARALMKAAVGETVVLRSPTGIETLEILAIRYPDA